MANSESLVPASAGQLQFIYFHQQALRLTGKQGYDGHVRRFNLWNKGHNIQAGRILAFLKELSFSVKPQTLQNYKQALKYSIKLSIYDVRQLATLDAFFKELKTVKADSKIYTEQVLTKKEYETLIAHCPEKISLICKVLHHTGLRISELLSIRLSHCKHDGVYTYVQIVGKNRKARRVILDRFLYNRIVRAFNSSDHLFASHRGGSYSREHICRLINKYSLEFLGRSIHPHTFRHSFATRHIKRKHSVKAVSNYLGHSSTSITEQMYVHDEMQAEELWPQVATA